MLALINLIIRRTRLAFRTPLASPCSSPPALLPAPHPALIPGPVLPVAGRALGRSSCGLEVRGAGKEPGPPPARPARGSGPDGRRSPRVRVRLQPRPNGLSRQKARGPRAQPDLETLGSLRPRSPSHSLRPAQRLWPGLVAGALPSGAPAAAAARRGERARGLPDSGPAGPATPGLGRDGWGRPHLQPTGPGV